MARQTIGMLLLAAFPAVGFAQEISGRVVSAIDTTKAIGGARVVVRDSLRSGMRYTATTDDAGRFTLAVKPSLYVVDVVHVGYEPRTTGAFTANSGESNRLRIPMAPLATEISGTVTVELETVKTAYAAAMEGFERRRRLGMGQFITRQQLSERAGHLPDVLGDLPGIQRGMPLVGGPGPIMVRGKATQALRTERSGRITNVSADPLSYDDQFAAANVCPVVFYMNTVKLNSAYDPPTMQWTKVMTAYSMSVDDIEAIEFYRGYAEYPAEFAVSDAPCGIVVVWGRRSTTPTDKH